MDALSASSVALLPVLAELLDYPSEGYHDLCRRACAKVRPWCTSESAEELDRFIAAVTAVEIEELEELHTRTFSLAPVCVPYLGVQLFGENNFKRGELLAGLSREVEKHGIATGTELSDHLGSVLRLAAVLPDDELNELMTWCLCIAVERMARQIEPVESPYKHLICAINWFINRARQEVTAHV